MTTTNGDMMTTTNRHLTHTRHENLRLVESVIGRRSWDDDDDSASGLVSQYDSEEDARADAARLAAQGLQTSTSCGNVDCADEGKGYLWVLVGEK